MTLAETKSGVVSLVSSAEQFIKDNIGTIGAGVGGLAVGSALGVATGLKMARARRKTTRKRKTRKSHPATRKKRKTRRIQHKRRVRRTPRTAGKRKDTSHKRIRHTKKGQPYIILASGKARFIKKSSARQSRKRKGGKY
jgi:hypothetical protein